MNRRISVIGLGYVGLPVATSFARIGATVVAFDIDARRIGELAKGHDRTGEVTAAELGAKGLNFTTRTADLRQADFHIVTVRAPIEHQRQPQPRSPPRRLDDHRRRAEEWRHGLQIPVYPGVTEDVCVPVLERTSGLKWKSDFNVGYSPERINPGDKERRFDDVLEDRVGRHARNAGYHQTSFYRSVVTAGTPPAPIDPVAEFAKVLENTQRDVNIALINEVALICDRIGVEPTTC